MFRRLVLCLFPIFLLSAIAADRLLIVLISHAQPASSQSIWGEWLALRPITRLATGVWLDGLSHDIVLQLAIIGLAMIVIVVATIVTGALGVGFNHLALFYLVGATVWPNGQGSPNYTALINNSDPIYWSLMVFGVLSTVLSWNIRWWSARKQAE